LVAAEVRREVRKPRHQLLARAQELDGPQLRLDARIPPRRRVGEGEKRAIEDLAAPEWRERRSIRRDTDGEIDRRISASVDRDGPADDFPRCASRIVSDLQREVIPRRQTRLRHAYDLAAAGVNDGDARLESRTQLGDVARMEQRELAAPLV